MANVGNVSVNLDAQMAKFESDMGRAARIMERDIQKQARASQRSLNQMETAAKSVGRSMGVALASGVGAAAAAVSLYIKNTIEAEKVQAQLEARIRDTGAAANRTLAQLNEQADRLQQVTIFDDEAVGEAQAMLMTFKQIEGLTFDRTIEAALDLATVMGTDAASAAKLLGKALNDPERGLAALSKAGVTFGESERKRIETMLEAGRVTEAQAAILDKLQGTMGTAAEAARNTLGGAFTALKNAAMNALEGDSGSDGIRGVRQAVETMTSTLNDPKTKEGIESLISGLLRVANMAIQASAKIGEFASDVANTFSKTPDLKFQEDSIKAMKALIAQREKDFNPNTPLFGTKRLREELKQMEASYNALRGSALEADLQRQFQAAIAPLRPRAAAGGAANDDEDLVKPQRSGGRTARRAAPEADMAKVIDFSERLAGVQARMQGALDKVSESQREAIGEWARLTAEVEGPLKVAELEHIERMLQIETLGKRAGAGAAEIEAAKAKETKAYEQVTAAMKKQQEAAENPELTRAMDGLRQVGYDFLVDLPRNGAGAWKNALADIERMITQWAAKGIIDQLFGEAGTTGSGTSGGGMMKGLFDWFGQAAGSWFGGGRAVGGPVSAGKVYRVNERSTEPEFFQPGSSGRVIPLGRIAANFAQSARQEGGGSSHIQQTFNTVIQGAYTRRTAEQGALATGRESRRAMARNGVRG